MRLDLLRPGRVSRRQALHRNLPRAIAVEQRLQQRRRRLRALLSLAAHLPHHATPKKRPPGRFFAFARAMNPGAPAPQFPDPLASCRSSNPNPRRIQAEVLPSRHASGADCHGFEALNEISLRLKPRLHRSPPSRRTGADPHRRPAHRPLLHPQAQPPRHP